MRGAPSGRSGLLLEAPVGVPNLRLGLRTTLASVPPLLGASLLHEPSLIWMALGGLYVNLADTGGAYRTKATAMAGATVLGAVALGAGIGLAAWPWLCVPAMFAVGLGCGLLSLYGNAGALIGLVTAWCFLIGINVAGADPAKALAWSFLYLAGGVWATVLAVAVWPLRPYRPVRLAVAEAHRAIAGYLSLACPANGGMPAAEERLYQEKVRVRNALSSARATLADTRCGRLGDSPADGAFTRLIETADTLFVTSAALGDLLAAIPAGEETGIRRRIGALNGRCGAALLELDRSPTARAEPSSLGGLGDESRRIAEVIEDLGPSAARSALRRAHACQAHWIATLEQTVEAFPSAALDRRETTAQRKPGRWGTALEQGWATLRANLTPESSVFRHALRFGTASAVAVGVYTLFALPIGYWITLTVSVILRPSAGETLSRTHQRVLGTVLGGILAIVLATLFPHPLTIVLLMVPLTVVMMAVLPVNYGLFVFFLTPWIVLYKDIDQPGDWGLALWRIANTLIGAGLALAAIHLILPRWERHDLPARLAASLRCNARFVEEVLDPSRPVVPGGNGPSTTASAVRLAMGNAQCSIQRYLSETPAHRSMALPLMAFLLHSQRLIDALVVRQSCDQQPGSCPAPVGLRPLRERIVATLAALASALEHHEPPAAVPELGRDQARLLGLDALLDPIVQLQRAVEAWCAWERGAAAPPAPPAGSAPGGPD